MSSMKGEFPHVRRWSVFDEATHSADGGVDKRRDERTQPRRICNTVRIEKRDKFSARETHAAIAASVCAEVFLVSQQSCRERRMCEQLFHALGCSVGRSIVDDDEFHREGCCNGEILRENRAETCERLLASPVCRNDDTDARPRSNGIVKCHRFNVRLYCALRCDHRCAPLRESRFLERAA